MVAEVVEMIRIDALWLAVEPMDMRADATTLLPRQPALGQYSSGADSALPNEAEFPLLHP